MAGLEKLPERVELLEYNLIKYIIEHHVVNFVEICKMFGGIKLIFNNYWHMTKFKLFTGIWN